jgi:hypothetical protein
VGAAVLTSQTCPYEQEVTLAGVGEHIASWHLPLFEPELVDTLEVLSVSTVDMEYLD